MKLFKISRRDQFRFDAEGNGPRFSASVRQQVLEHVICGQLKDGGAELDVGTPLGKYIVQKFPLHKYQQLFKLSHSWVTFWKREAHGVIPRPWSPLSVPLSYTLKSSYLAVAHFVRNLFVQPLDDIVEYFGETVGFYFAFLAFYTKWLFIPAIVGIIVFCVQVPLQSSYFLITTFDSTIF